MPSSGAAPVTYVGCLNVHHDSVDCPTSGEPMESWCSPCGTRSHLIDEHMACMGAASAMVDMIATCDAETLAHIHNIATAQRIADGREPHDHARNVWRPNVDSTGS